MILCANAGILRRQVGLTEALFGMNLTPYHAKLFAHELTKRCPSDSIEKLASTLVDAQVDLNPHQIEAGLVVSQKWAERMPSSECSNGRSAKTMCGMSWGSVRPSKGILMTHRIQAD